MSNLGSLCNQLTFNRVVASLKYMKSMYDPGFSGMLLHSEKLKKRQTFCRQKAVHTLPIEIPLPLYNYNNYTTSA